MIFHDNRLLADDSHEISFLISFQNNRKDVTKFVSAAVALWDKKLCENHVEEVQGDTVARMHALVFTSSTCGDMYSSRVQCICPMPERLGC